jgi:4-hydroxyphenylpyruvate dioxygenase
MTPQSAHEGLAEPGNPLGLDGIEFIEYATTAPQALGRSLEAMGFLPVARHRSREVMLYRQGTMNIVVNAHAAEASSGHSPAAEPVISALALRVRDAAESHKRVLGLGAWAVPIRVEVMELHIPAIHGVGRTRIYFVDRYRDFSIFDVDFVPIPGVERNPPALAGLQWFGIVQYIGVDRLEDWTEFYRDLLGFAELPDEQRFGIMPGGRILESPCGSFYLQLVEPLPGLLDLDGEELLARIGLGTPDVPGAVQLLRQRGVDFREQGAVHADARGALTTPLGGITFELVHQAARAPQAR